MSAYTDDHAIYEYCESLCRKSLSCLNQPVGFNFEARRIVLQYCKSSQAIEGVLSMTMFMYIMKASVLF